MERRLKINVKISDIFRFDYISVDLTLTKTRVGFVPGRFRSRLRSRTQQSPISARLRQLRFPTPTPTCSPTLQVAFGFGASLRILGIDISFNIYLDSGGTPWNAVVNFLKDKILEPLTGKTQHVIKCVFV